jgi:hypothetical protein
MTMREVSQSHGWVHAFFPSGYFSSIVKLVCLVALSPTISLRAQSLNPRLIPDEEASLVQAFNAWDIAFYENQPALQTTLSYIKAVSSIPGMKERTGEYVREAAIRLRMVATPEDITQLLKNVDTTDRSIVHSVLSAEDESILGKIYHNRNDPMKRGQYNGVWVMPKPERLMPAEPAVINVAEARRRAALGDAWAYYDLTQIYTKALGVKGGGSPGLFWMTFWMAYTGSGRNWPWNQSFPTNGSPQEQISYYSTLAAGEEHQAGFPSRPKPGSQYARWMVISIELKHISNVSDTSRLIDALRRMAHDGHPAAMRLLIQYIRNKQFGLSDSVEADFLEQRLSN